MIVRKLLLFSFIGGVFLFQQTIFSARSVEGFRPDKLDEGYSGDELPDPREHEIDDGYDDETLRKLTEEEGRERVDYLRTLKDGKGVFTPKLVDRSQVTSVVALPRNGSINVDAVDAAAIREIAGEHEKFDRSKESVVLSSSKEGLLREKRELLENFHAEVVRVLDKEMRDNPALFEKMGGYRRMNEYIHDFQVRVMRAKTPEDFTEASEYLDDVVEKIRGSQDLMLEYRDEVQAGKKKPGFFRKKLPPTADELASKEEEHAKKRTLTYMGNDHQGNAVRLRNLNQRYRDIIRARDQLLEERAATKDKEKFDARLALLSKEAEKIDQQIETITLLNTGKTPVFADRSSLGGTPTNAVNVFVKGASPVQLGEDMRLEDMDGGSESEKKHEEFYSSLRRKFKDIVVGRNLAQGGKYGDEGLVREINKKLQELAEYKFYKTESRNEKLKADINNLVEQIQIKLIAEQGHIGDERDLSTPQQRKINRAKTRFAIYKRPSQKKGAPTRVPADIVLAQDSGSGKAEWLLALNRTDRYVNEENKDVYDKIRSELNDQMRVLNTASISKNTVKKIHMLYDQINEQLEDLAQPGLTSKKIQKIKGKIDVLIERAKQVLSVQPV